jgi:cytochrome c-type protein NapB
VVCERNEAVPHPIEQRSADACLACHEKGLVAGERRAPAISHRAMTNCTQCHVEARDPAAAPPAPADVANTFAGLASPSGGARVHEGAPPTMPHGSWMRERCNSCHGASGHRGLQTSHLERRSCEQCHGSSATLEQREFGVGGPPTPRERP